MSDSKGDSVLDFTHSSMEIGWRAIDDRIMGGCSRSQADHIPGQGLRFSGTVSLQNNGGFASIRSESLSADLSRYNGIIIRVCGDGKTFKLSLRTDLFFDGISYQRSFETTAGQWQEIRLPFDTFTPTHHGIKLSTVAPMDISNIKSFGFFVADRQSGTFQLDIAWIKGY